MTKWIISDSDGADDEAIAGQRLARARSEKNISLRDIAKELHLDEPKVRALEENRFDDLGAAVFAKGHLKKYAELVEVPVDDVMSDYYKMTRSAPPPPVVGTKHKAPREFSPGPWIAGAVFVLVAAAIAALVYWYLTSADAPRTDSAPVESAPMDTRPADPGQDSVSMPLPGPAEAESGLEDAMESAPAAGETLPAEEVEETATPEVPAQADAGPAALQLSLVFSGDCWTEVSDADGARLFFGLGSAGRTITVSGAPPLRVLLGNSDNVVVQVDGADYQIAPGDRRGNTARFTLPAR